jgi:hypothetical protein
MAAPQQDRTPRPPPALISCAQLAVVPELGHCPAGAETVTVDLDFGGAVIDKSSMAGITWPASTLSTAAVQNVPISTIAIATNGSDSAVEHARSVLEAAFPTPFAPMTLREYKS